MIYTACNKQNIIFFFALFLLISSTTVNSFYVSGQQQQQRQSLIPQLFGNGNNPSLLNNAFNKVKDSVVQITTQYKSSDTNSQLFDTGSGANPTPTKYGSGFVYDKAGYIITNYHVVAHLLTL